MQNTLLGLISQNNLAGIKELIDTNIKFKPLFEEACKNKNLEIARYLTDFISLDQAFRVACFYNFKDYICEFVELYGECRLNAKYSQIQNKLSDCYKYSRTAKPIGKCEISDLKKIKGFPFDRNEIPTDVYLGTYMFPENLDNYLSLAKWLVEKEIVDIGDFGLPIIIYFDKYRNIDFIKWFITEIYEKEQIKNYTKEYQQRYGSYLTDLIDSEIKTQDDEFNTISPTQKTINNIFIQACKNGLLDLAKWLRYNFNAIDTVKFSKLVCCNRINGKCCCADDANIKCSGDNLPVYKNFDWAIENSKTPEIIEWLKEERAKLSE